MQSSLHISKPTLYFCASLFVIQASYGFSAARNGVYHRLLNWRYPLILYWALGWWFVSDSRGYRMKWQDRFLEMSLFSYIAWIFILPYYLFKSRGWKAVFTMIMLTGIYVGAPLLRDVLYLMSSRTQQHE